MRSRKLSEDLAEAVRPLADIQPELVKVLAADLETRLSIKLDVEADVAEIVKECSALQALDDDVRESLSEVVVGLHLLRTSHGSPIEEVVRDVTATVTDAYADLSDEAVSNLQSNLQSIFSISKVRASVKAFDLLDDREKVYIHSRAVTEIRPIFDEDISSNFLGSLVVHTLKISHRTAGARDAIYLSLDTADLHDLQDTLFRAIEKAEAINSRLEQVAGGHFGVTLDVKANNE